MADFLNDIKGKIDHHPLYDFHKNPLPYATADLTGSETLSAKALYYYTEEKGAIDIAKDLQELASSERVEYLATMPPYQFGTKLSSQIS